MGIGFSIITKPLTVRAATSGNSTVFADTPTAPRKRDTDSSSVNIKSKKERMQTISTSGFIALNTSLRRGVMWFYRKNIENVSSYRIFLNTIKSELTEKLRELVNARPIKYNLKLETSYAIPNVEASLENRAFKTSAREAFMYSDIDSLIDQDYNILLAEEDKYAGVGSGFTLSHIDGILLGIFTFKPLGGSSYMKLPNSITCRKTVVNPQNIDQKCFQWAILVKHVVKNARDRVDVHYRNELYRYDFSSLSTPTPVSEVNLFERYNPGTSVNVYGIRENKKSMKAQTVYPIRVADEEKPNHFDLLFIYNTDTGKSHYTFISNFSRLVRKQLSL